MEKLKGRWDNDDHGIPCLVLYKNREKFQTGKYMNIVKNTEYVESI